MHAPYNIGDGSAVKLSILGEAQNWRCCYCGIRTRENQDEWWNCASREHVVPRSQKGAAIGWENEVMACRLCNSGRGAMSWERYLKKAQAVGRWKAFRWARARISPNHSSKKRRRAHRQ